MSISSRPFSVPTISMTSIALVFTPDQILNFGGQVQGNGFPAFESFILLIFLCSSGKTGAPLSKMTSSFQLPFKPFLNRINTRLKFLSSSTLMQLVFGS